MPKRSVGAEARSRRVRSGAGAARPAGDIGPDDDSLSGCEVARPAALAHRPADNLGKEK